MTDDAAPHDTGEKLDIGPLPVGGRGHRASGWFGMMTLIATEASLFLYLLFSYFYFVIWSDGDFLPAKRPGFALSGPDTAILLLSSVAVWWGERGARKNSRRQLAAGLAVGFGLGAIFVAIQLLEWAGKPFHFADSSYSSLYFTITGFHLAHVVIGMGVLAVLFVWSLLGYFHSRDPAAVSIGAVYWHFVDAVWLAVFLSIYVSPYLGPS